MAIEWGSLVMLGALVLEATEEHDVQRAKVASSKPVIDVKIELQAGQKVKDAIWTFQSTDSNITVGSSVSAIAAPANRSPGDIGTAELSTTKVTFDLKSDKIEYCSDRLGGTPYQTVFGLKDVWGKTIVSGLTIYIDEDTKKGKVVPDLPQPTPPPSSGEYFTGQSLNNQAKQVSVGITTHSTSSSPSYFLYGLNVVCIPEDKKRDPIIISGDPRIRNGGGVPFVCTGSTGCP